MPIPRLYALSPPRILHAHRIYRALPIQASTILIPTLDRTLFVLSFPLTPGEGATFLRDGTPRTAAVTALETLPFLTPLLRLSRTRQLYS